jgi:hypothetical protein
MLQKCLICELTGDIRQKLESAKTLRESKNIAIEEGLAYCYLSHLANHRKYHSNIKEKLEEVKIITPQESIQRINTQIDIDKIGVNQFDDLSNIQKHLARIMFKMMIISEDNLDSAIKERNLPSRDVIEGLKKVSDIYAKFHGIDVAVNVNRAIELLTNLGFNVSDE